MKDVSAISGLMGSYLLKGWIMLGDACPSCEEVPLLEDPSNGLKYCMKCSPPITSGRNLNNKLTESLSNEGKLSVLTNTEADCANKESDRTIFKNSLEKNVNYMMVEISKIGVNALNSGDFTIEKR
ncbi:Sjoegren syndrome scleroderma autoantigen [Cryptosporidium sp. chipmunk genotype I]|uniref:Sjoegren syndrome scleroderma autoantigen n=1 Tax=Cryptosporidium sp. chipmunk genotype I TaxID=1280935 RepID=UPI003519DAD2|nr:Sjoegren syndrome scleroderma autoantigen [Cryptosporidium sp. chipmunk genotype I]